MDAAFSQQFACHLAGECAAVGKLSSALSQASAVYGKLIPVRLMEICGSEKDGDHDILSVELGDHTEKQMTVMFSDIRNFTSLTEGMTTRQSLRFINSYFGQMDSVIAHSNGIVDKFIGDGIMALFPSSADDALRGAIDMIMHVCHYNEGRVRANYDPIQIGIGLNTGIVMVCIVGGEHRMSSTVIGDAVNLASRLEEATKMYHTPIVISQSTLNDLADNDQYCVRFLDRIKVKGRTQPVSIYEVFDCDDHVLRRSKITTISMFEKAVSFYHMRNIEDAHVLFSECLEITPEDEQARIYLRRCEDYRASGIHHGTGEMTVKLEWKLRHSSGIEDLDVASREVVNKLNELTLSVANGDRGSMLRILKFLRWHCDGVFPIEESLMKEHRYPLAEHHVHAHRRFAVELESLTAQMEEKESEFSYLAFRGKMLILDWFESHMSGTDHHFIRFLKEEVNQVCL